VGERFGVTRERIRQIQEQALKTILEDDGETRPNPQKIWNRSQWPRNCQQRLLKG